MFTQNVLISTEMDACTDLHPKCLLKGPHIDLVSLLFAIVVTIASVCNLLSVLVELGAAI